MLNPNTGDIVVFNNLPDAAKFEVVDRFPQHFTLEVKEAGTDYRSQFVDQSQVIKIVGSVNK